MIPTKLSSYFRRLGVAIPVAFATVSALTLSGCTGDSGSGDTNYSQKFDKPTASGAPTPAPAATGKKNAPTPNDNPNDQKAIDRRKDDRDFDRQGGAKRR